MSGIGFCEYLPNKFATRNEYVIADTAPGKIRSARETKKSDVDGLFKKLLAIGYPLSKKNMLTAKLPKVIPNSFGSSSPSIAKECDTTTKKAH